MEKLAKFFYCMLLCSAAHAAFKNPIFTSQDPWITLVNGTYYYTESYCGVADICVKAWPNLTDIGAAPWIGLWNAQSGQINSNDIWAPELHYVQGGWYIYYAADDGSDDNHRIFVIQSSSPLGPYVEANNGNPHGMMKDNTGWWGIDPDVFIAADGNLYMTWSCKEYSYSYGAQHVCLAPLKDPITIGGSTVVLSSPTEYWELRNSPVQEGPVGYTHNGRTHITYSASCSWTDNDYSVGVLSLAAGADPLVAENWSKSGPVLDHHSTVYGPGSVVFVPSIDGSEYWVLYHAVWNATCLPEAYACRDVRMQQMFFDEEGFPVLGYPINSGVIQQSPAGEAGAPAGITLVPQFGDAWGDAAEGNARNGNGATSGNWTYVASTDVLTSSLGGSYQIFVPNNPNPQNYIASVNVQHVQTGTTIGNPKLGLYCSYDDAGNFVQLWLDVVNNVLATVAMVGHIGLQWQNGPLPSGFDPTQWHTLTCQKQYQTYTFSIDGTANFSRQFDIVNGQIGYLVVDTIANFYNLTVASI